VALNPYLQTHDGHTDLGDADVLIIHGTKDQIASLRVVEAATQLLRRRGTVTLVRVAGGKHATLARHGQFDSLAAEFVTSRLLGEPSSVLSDGTGISRTIDV
jgi:alpha-beta hydrolase superfamily lysophospholipase